MQNVKLPDVGEGVTEGEVVKWLVKVGDTVKSDQPVLEIMTDKATVEVPSPYSGVVKELKVKEGDIVPIESVILVLDDVGAEAKPSAAVSAATPSAQPAKPTPVAPAKSHGPAAPALAASARLNGGGGLEVYPPAADLNVLATPNTRRLAREMNVNINTISGTGLAGRVTREDVLNIVKSSGGYAAVTTSAMGTVTASAASAPSKTTLKPLPAMPILGTTAADERVPLRGVRRKIAEQMQMTKQVVPHFTIMDEATVDGLTQMRTQAKAVGEQYGVKITFLPFIMKALLATLREYPMFNASIDDAAQEIVYRKSYNIGFAADTPNGLLVPVVKNVDQKSILQIARDIQDLAGKARSGKISSDEMKGATITITNIGSVGGTYATPIINHPEVAIIGMYKIETKPFWDGTQFKPKQTMNFTATCDHRLIDGAVAANFLKALISRIENPTQLMLEMI